MTLLAMLAVLIAAALVFYRLAGMPPASGQLQVPGLTEPATVIRDRHGIAHVFAASPNDAFFVLGLLHAQERSWQMEMNRRIVGGRMAEVLGPAALDNDRFLRVLGVRRNAQQIWEGLDVATRAAVQAYTDGINAGVADRASRPWRRAPEFLLLGTQPMPWEPADVIGWATMMAWDLSGNHGAELLRLALLGKLDPARVAQLLDTDPPSSLPDPRTLYGAALPARTAQASGASPSTPDLPSLARHAQSLAVSLARAFPSSGLDGLGSNSWLVDGRRSASGKPLLANDPHLGLSVPSLWYFAHLSAPGLSVIGATLPGLPYIVVGRSQRLAWGFTNTLPDSQDLYLERIDPQDPSRYLTPDGWAAFTTRTETIHVKGAADVTLTVRATRHGPVISDALGQATAALALHGLDGHALSFAWTMLSPEDRTIRAALGFNLAPDRGAFVNALRDFRGPQQNILYADVDGGVGFIAAGGVPLRDPANTLQGRLPAPGWEAVYDWRGLLPFEALPQREHSDDGMLVTANQRIVDERYPHFIAGEWALPYRSDRIKRLLRERPLHDAASFAEIQSDVGAPAVGELMTILLRTRPQSRRATDALTMLREWSEAQDTEAPALSVERPEPLIAVAWIDRLRREIFEDETGELFALLERHRSRHHALQYALTRADHAGWCDDVRTPAAETCDDMLSRSLEAVLDELGRRYGADPRRWSWGEAHPAVAEHRPFSRHWLLARVFELRSPSGGDPSSINVARHNPWDPDEPLANRWAASLRAIYDLAEPENSVFIHSTGQSGHLLSPHYSDMNPLWTQGRYVPMVMDRQRIEREAAQTLSLVPR
ncbi:MAG: penicillin acylase family protein [Burkholderiaceae bacterium]